jgi:hypothetical protein
MQEILNNDFILVLGAKPEFKIPNLHFKYIYAANGAIERVKNYKNSYSNFELISVIGGREFEKNNEVKKRVLDSDPDKIICRLGKIDTKKYEKLNNVLFKYLNNFQQVKFQSMFFKFGMLEIIFQESFYEKKLTKKIKHLFNSFKNNSLVGVSTGFFSILYALSKHPNNKIFIAGIGMSGGSHMYNDANRYNKRSIVDRRLILSLKKEFKARLYTTDIDLSKFCNLNYFKG